jgi:hypothetical protein
MKSIAVAGVVLALGGLGCASARGESMVGDRELAGIVNGGGQALRVGEPRVVEGRVRLSLPIRDARSTRVALDGGRYVICWTEGTVEGGRRAWAQTFSAGGVPEGAPAVLSPPDVDVVGAPSAVATDGQHLVATFAVASERSVELLSVPVESQGPAAGGSRTAER